MSPRKQAGFTLTELLVVVCIIIGFCLVTPHCGSPADPTRGQMNQTLSNMKQLHLATTQMALDGSTTGETNLGWPGDTGGTFSNWTAQLLKGNYLSTNDLCKLLSAPGRIAKPGDLAPTNNTAILVYAVRDASATNAVIFTTANFTNTPTGGILDPAAKPYGNKGFVVFRKAGDGVVLQPKQVGQTNVIGSFVPLLR